MPTVRFQPDDREIELSSGENLLSASLKAGIPHTHVCGGRARCSTCRVLIADGLNNCSPRNAKETALAERLRFEPRIRLACQTSIDGQVALRRLVLDARDIKLTSQLNPASAHVTAGEEKELAIMFSDIRNFTSFSENLLPYDVIHLLNRYFDLIFEVIAKHGGQIDNIMGDGILALFGVDETPAAALNAVRAGLEMIEAVEGLAPYVQATYGTRCFRTGVGIHFGTAVIGTVGTGEAKRRTVIGDSVNFASRIESANKDAGTRLLISEATLQRVRERVQCGRQVQVRLKGKAGDHQLTEIVGLLDRG